MFLSSRPVLFLGLTLATLNTACSVEEGSGIIEERTQSLSSYDRIDVSDGFKASIILGDEFGVKIFADDNIMQRVRVVQEGDEVRVDLRDGHYSDVTLEVEFTMPQVQGISLSDGSRLIGTELPLVSPFAVSAKDGSELQLEAAQGENVDFLEIDSSDGSRMRVAIPTDEAVVSVSDGGELELKGAANSMVLDVSDGSRLDALSFPVSELDVQMSDGSEAIVKVQDRVEGSLKDGSLLTIDGAPKVNVDESDGSRVTRR